MIRQHKGSTPGSRNRYHEKYIKKRAAKAKRLGKSYSTETGFLYDKNGNISKEQ